MARASDSEEFLQNTRVLGKGVESRETHERLQLACVGAPIAEGSLERDCAQLQFVVADLSGKTRRIGPLFSISESEGHFRKQFKRQLLQAGVNKRPTEEETNIFQRYLLDPITGKSTHLGRVAIAVVFMMGAGAVGMITGGFGWTVAILLSPALLDPMFRPLTRALVQKQGGVLAHASNLKTLNDRSQLGWQLKPRRVNHRNFARAVKALGGTPRDTVVSAEKSTILYDPSADELTGAAECNLQYADSKVEHETEEMTFEGCVEYCESHSRRALKADEKGKQSATCFWGRLPDKSSRAVRRFDWGMFQSGVEEGTKNRIDGISSPADEAADEHLVEVADPAAVDAILNASPEETGVIE